MVELPETVMRIALRAIRASGPKKRDELVSDARILKNRHCNQCSPDSDVRAVRIGLQVGMVGIDLESLFEVL